MKSTVTKEIVKFGNDASRRLYRGATEAARKLETRLGQGSNLTELFSSEITELRMRLKDYCERLIFADPVEYGKKAEDLLWRKVFYDFFWRCKQNRRKLLESEYHRNAFRSHLLAGIGFYHHLLLRIQTEFHLNLEGKVDVPLLWHLKGVKKERWKKYQLSAASDENVQTWADQASHRILIYLGDLERYIAELDEPESNHLAERYYQQAFCLNSQNGTPHNQLGSLYSNRFDSAYHYMRCLSSRERFEGADNNLVRLFEKNEEVIKQLYSSDCVEKKSLKCTRFLSRFLKLCQMFYFKPSENYNAQTYCQDILKEFGITRSASTYENDSETEDIDAWLSEDIIFKVVVMSLLCVWKSQEKGPTYASVAISFSFAFFSYVVQRVTRQLSIAILDLKPTESLQNGCIIENEKNLSKQLTLSISKEQLDDTSEENEINKDLLLKKMSGKKSSLKKFSARRLHRLRRRRKLSSTSQDDSELSDGEMSDLPESDEESGLLNSDVSCSSESDDEDENIIEENGLSIDGELDANLDNNLILTNGISKNLSDDNAKENHDESDKNSSIDVNSVLGNPTIAPEKFVHILRKIKLLPCLKILTDWLRINENILSAGAVTSPYLLSCLIELLNILLKIEDKLSNDRFQRLLKNDETVIQDYPLPEDTVLQSFPILKDIHSKLSFDVSKRRALSTSEQVYLRVQCLLSFGKCVIKASESSVDFDSEKKKYYFNLSNKAKESNKEEMSSVKTANRDAESQKHYLMRSMAHLWLKAEVDDLETFVEGQASRQLSPILVTDASVLCCNLPAIKQLVNTKKFIVVVPLVVIANLDQLKKESIAAREATRWLEFELCKGGRHVRAQNQVEKSSLVPMKYPRKKDKEAWDFYQVLECCNYLVQQQTNGKSNCHLVTLLVGSFHHLPDNAIAIAQSIDVTIEKIGSFFAKWRTSLKKPG
ncbi:nonsense-mediated mRNA decay factor SMG5-like isoform X2 [Argiope bruennichi]|uniref:nonsense-mediated mRNA decay factor SMG5-like isoform X2 n=1 Tax=Argiope bruennichi TaxID=94029 RepID=UPI0024942660|nr:nonsense-mediated mRNA decay factor SMG5-like isoform X2 [Argiope bruennichi]